MSIECDAWITEKINDWIKKVNTLAEVAKRFPQSAYSGFCRSLQMEWQYIQRVVPGIAPLFQPLEKAIQDQFLPALLGENDPITGELRKILSLSTKSAGIGIWDPVETCNHNFTTSLEVTELISDSLIQNTDMNVGEHQTHAAAERRSASTNRHEILPPLGDGLRSFSLLNRTIVRDEEVLKFTRDNNTSPFTVGRENRVAGGHSHV